MYKAVCRTAPAAPGMLIIVDALRQENAIRLSCRVSGLSKNKSKGTNRKIDFNILSEIEHYKSLFQKRK